MLAARERTLSDHTQRVLRVLVHVQTRLDADLSLERLARLANMSPHHFQRVFAAICGESSKRHVQRLRLERAARELREGRHDMTEVAEGAGYSDVPTFYRAFRSHFGSSPAQWRERAVLGRAARTQPASLCRWRTATGADGQLRSEAHLAATAPADAGPVARVLQLARLRIAFVRRTGPVAPKTIAADFTRLLEFASRRNSAGDPLLLRIHHDDAAITPVRRRRIDHAITIGPRRRGEADIGTWTIGDSEMLVATCAGDHDTVADVRDWLEHEGMAERGALRRRGPVLEILLDGPGHARDALHDLLVPIVPCPTTQSWYWRRRRAPPNRLPPPPPERTSS